MPGNAHHSNFYGPLFIVGMPRSGTKLLRSILNKHSRICIPEIETEFLFYWINKINKFGDLNEFSNFKKFYEWTIRLPYFIYRKERCELIDVNDWYASCGTFNVQDIFKALICTDECIEKDQIWGDKSPSYLTHVFDLKKLYEEAKFIHIVRDVRDYCLSINYAFGKNMYRAAQRWADDITTSMEQGQDLKKSYIQMRYEDLITQPEENIRRICTFLDIKYEADMIQLSASTENIGSAKNTRGILKTNKKKYVEQMSPSIRRRIETIAGGVLKKLGYEGCLVDESRRLPKWMMTIYFLLDGFNIIALAKDRRNIFSKIIFYVRYVVCSGNRQR